MSYISWSRVAYIFFVLAVLAALLKLGSIGLSDSSPLHQAAARTLEAQRTEIQQDQSIEATEVIMPSVDDNSVPESANTIEIRRDGSSAAPRKSENGTTIFYRPADKQKAKKDKPSDGRSSKDKPTRRESSKGNSARGNSARGNSARGSSPQGGFSAGLGSGDAEPVCGNLRNVFKNNTVVFPLSDQFFNSYDDTWGAARPQGGHEGTDLMTPMNTPEYAMTDATVVPVSGANGNGWNTLGGYTLMLRADYSIGPIQKGDLFYYAHLDREASLKIGSRVEAGQLIGYAGDTGQGSEITRGLFPPHLHLGWYDTSGSRTSAESGAMNPFPLLEWIKTNGGSVSGGSDAKYCTAPRTGPPIPSNGEQSWPIPDNPTERPDIDTGGPDAAPSPIVNTAPNTPKKSPRQNKTSKDGNTSSAKSDVTPPKIKDKTRVGSQTKSPKLEVPKARKIVRKVRGVIDRAFNIDERVEPGKNKAEENEKRREAIPSSRKDKPSRNETKCETSNKPTESRKGDAKKDRRNNTKEECANTGDNRGDNASNKRKNEDVTDKTESETADNKSKPSDKKPGEVADEKNTDGEDTTAKPPEDEENIAEDPPSENSEPPSDEPAAEEDTEEAPVDEELAPEETAPVEEEPLVEETTAAEAPQE